MPEPSAELAGRGSPPDSDTFDAFMALELRDGYLGTEGGKWYEDEVFEIDEAAFEVWNKSFMANVKQL